MKVIEAIEGGITGTSTLVMLQELLYKIDAGSPLPISFIAVNKLSKKGNKRRRYYIQLAKDVMATISMFSLTALGAKNKAVLRGALVGGAAGIWQASQVSRKKKGERQLYKEKLLTLVFYAAAGALAGKVVKALPVPDRKEKIRAAKNHEAQVIDSPTTDRKMILSTILYIEGTPVGYEVHRNNENIIFKPTQYTAKDCCPPLFQVIFNDKNELIFDPISIEQYIKDQAVQDVEGLKAGNFLI